MNPYIITSAFKDFARPVRIIGWFLMIIFLAGIAWIWKFNGKGLSPLEAYGQMADVFIFRVAGLAAAVMSMGVIAQEIDQRTIVYLLTRSQPRWAILVGRWIAAVAATTLIGWVTVLACSVSVMGLDAVTNMTVIRDLGIMCLAAIAYCSIFTLVSLIINRALIFCLLFAFGWETFAQNLEGMSRLSVLTYLNALTNHPDLKAKGLLTFMAGDMTFNKPAAWLAFMALAGITVVTVGLAVYAFQNFEYSPREDAE